MWLAGKIHIDCDFPIIPEFSFGASLPRLMAPEGMLILGVRTPPSKPSKKTPHDRYIHSSPDTNPFLLVWLVVSTPLKNISQLG